MSMKASTLLLLYFTKYLELTFLIAWTGLVCSSGIYYIGLITDRSHGDGDALNIAAVSACIVLAVFNLFYNTLLYNLRFLIKIRSVTFGLCCFDAFNYLFCACICDKPCRDRCFTPWSIIKWILKAAIIGVTIFLVSKKKSDWEEAFEVGSMDLELLERTRIDAYLIVYLL